MSSSRFHIDRSEITGDAQKVLFFWDFTSFLLDRLLQVTVQTNQVCQSIKSDPPTFLMEYLAEEKLRVRELRAKLNKWMGQHQDDPIIPQSTFNALAAINDAVKRGKACPEYILQEAISELNKRAFELRMLVDAAPLVATAKSLLTEQEMAMYLPRTQDEK